MPEVTAILAGGFKSCLTPHKKLTLKPAEGIKVTPSDNAPLG